MYQKSVCGVIFILFCTFQFGYAMKCKICDSESSCMDAYELYECNQTYANQTTHFLDTYYLDVNTNSISNNYNCMQQNLTFAISGVVKYMGCVYAHMKSCGYTFRPIYAGPNTEFSCRQWYEGCTGSGCNPADRKSISAAAMALPLVFFMINKYFV